MREITYTFAVSLRNDSTGEGWTVKHLGDGEEPGDGAFLTGEFAP